MVDSKQNILPGISARATAIAIKERLTSADVHQTQLQCGAKTVNAVLTKDPIFCSNLMV